MEDKEKLFIYGTLTDPGVQKEVWGRAIKGKDDSLKGYEKSEIEIDGEVYPFIVPNKNGQVGGLVVELTENELEKADRYEGGEYKK